jgi:hypothetical protein
MQNNPTRVHPAPYGSSDRGFAGLVWVEAKPGLLCPGRQRRSLPFNSVTLLLVDSPRYRNVRANSPPVDLTGGDTRKRGTQQTAQS